MFEQRLAAFKSTIYEELWPSQADVLDQFEAAHRKDPDLAIELPTGAGKTLIALLIADEAREKGERVAILTPNKVLAQQVKGQAEGLPGYQLVSFSGSKYQFDYQAVRRYEDAEAIGIMNYWVYFNSSPGVSPADLLIIDDAHLVESPLEGLFALDLPRRTFPDLYDEITGIVLQINPNLQQVRLMREDAAPPTTPPHLLAFPDLLQAQEAIEAAITRSAVPQLAETKFSWDAVQPRLRAMTILIGTRTIQIRPLIYPTQRERYRWSRKFIKPGRAPAFHATQGDNGCPYDCGFCPEHEQHACVTLFEITQACNLECPACFAASPHGSHASLDDIHAMLDAVTRAEGGTADVVMLSGGEPTIHPDFGEVMRRVSQSGRVRHTVVNTNGIRFARDVPLCVGAGQGAVFSMFWTLLDHYDPAFVLDDVRRHQGLAFGTQRLCGMRRHWHVVGSSHRLVLRHADGCRTIVDPSSASTGGIDASTVSAG